MSKQHAVKKRIATLHEIDGIMNAMKNLALLETHKLTVFLDTQHRAVTSIEAAAQDFLSFYPQIYIQAEELQQIWVIIGSERGFCGDFNELLVHALDTKQPPDNTLLLVIGSRLEAKLPGDRRFVSFIKSHSVVEEVQHTLLQLTETLAKLQQQTSGVSCISALYNDEESGDIRLRQLLPLAMPSKKSIYLHPPLLNLEPAYFLSQLTDQYLYAALHEIFYSSLMVENRKRLEHMDRAIHRLEKDEAELSLRFNRLRQEEIIEEIEIIMLSVEALSEDESN